MAKKLHKELVAGIDVSAETLQVALRALTGEIRDLVFTNDAAGHKKLCGLLGKRKHGARVCLEATSLYGLDVAIALHEAGVAVMVANPKAAKHFVVARMQRAKTDRVDARALLEFVLRMEFVAWAPPTKARQTLRLVARRIQDLHQQCTAEKNRLHALRATSTTPTYLLDDLEAHICDLEQRIETLVRHGEELLLADPDLAAAYRVISTVKGIKARSSIALLGELLLLPADMNVREVVAHAGLDPCPKESGRPPYGRRKISKVGNSHLRAALYMPALTASQHEPAVKAHYEALLAAGKIKMVAVVAVMRKLLHSLWRMIHTGEAFNGAKYRPSFAKAA
jgi:transposase